MANNIIHLDLAVAYDTVGSLQLLHKDIITKLHEINGLNLAMQDIWEGGAARKLEGDILDWMKEFGESMESFENLMYRVMKEFEEWQDVDVSGNFTPTHQFTYFDFSHEFTGSAEFLNSLKPLKPIPDDPPWWRVDKQIVKGAKKFGNMLWDGTKWVGKGLYNAGKTGVEWTLKGGKTILKGGALAAGATWGGMKATGGAIKDLFTTKEHIPEGKIAVEVDGQTVYYDANQAIPASGIPDGELPEGYIKVANGDLAIPASAIPASAIPASAIPASAIPASAIPNLPDSALKAIPASAIPASVKAIPASALPDGLPKDYIWVDNGNQAIPASALNAIPASAIPASAIPASAMSNHPYNAIPASAIPASVKAIPASALSDGIPDGYVWVDNGNQAIPASALSAIPASAIPASAIPASALPASAIPASAIPASVKAIPASNLPGGKLPDGYVWVDNGNQAIPASALDAIPASAIPASAIPASAIPASAIPASAIPASVMANDAIQASAIPASGIPDGYVWVDNGNTAIPASALENIYLDAIPSNAIPASVLNAIPASAIPASAIPASAVNLSTIDTRAISANAIDTGVMTTLAIPASAKAEGIPADYVWVDNGEYAIPASAIPASAIPASAIPASAIPSNIDKIQNLKGALNEHFHIGINGDLIAKDPDIFNLINAQDIQTDLLDPGVMDQPIAPMNPTDYLGN